MTGTGFAPPRSVGAAPLFSHVDMTCELFRHQTTCPAGADTFVEVSVCGRPCEVDRASNPVKLEHLCFEIKDG